MKTPAALRIGELSRRTDVSVELLRAWELRYRLLRPRRTSGGFRLYSEQDEWRVRRMRSLVGSGLSAAQAAAGVLEEERAGAQATVVPYGLLDEFDRALPAAHFEDPQPADIRPAVLFSKAAGHWDLDPMRLQELQMSGLCSLAHHDHFQAFFKDDYKSHLGT